jgi:hypothetical protein
MARLNLICKCSWKFFIPETTQGSEVTCPNCSEPVPIPGRKPGEEVVAPGMLAARKQMAATRVKILVGLVVAIIGVVVALVVVLGGKKETPEQEDTSDRPSKPAFSSTTPKTSTTPDYNQFRPDSSSSTTRPPTPAGPKIDPDKIEKLKRTATECQWLINVAGVVVEVLRLRGCTVDADRLTQQMGEFFNKIERSVGELATTDQRVRVEAHMMPGDRIINFAQRDLLSMKPADAATFLTAWLHALRANTLEECIVSRGQNRILLHFHFPEETKELLQLTRIPDTAVPTDAPSAPSAAIQPETGAVLLAVPPAVANDIKIRMQAINPAYVTIIPVEDSRRMESILKEMRGTAEDLAFLSNRITQELIARFEQEYAFIKQKVQELEPKVKEPTSVDVVFFKDGRKLEGKVEEDTADYVKIKSRLGMAKIPRADVARVEKGKGAANQFPEKLKAAKEKTADLVALMTWCKENNLKLEKEYVGYLVLTADPLHDKARIEVGLPRTLAGAPPKNASAPPQVEPSPVGRNEATVMAMEGIARDVTSKVTSLTDVINMMRTQTESLRYTQAVQPSEKSAPCLRWINNPLTFSLSNVPAASAVEVGTWWGTLTPNERQEFAKFFGLWCAYQRFQLSK